jgi:hypothetical protein
MEKEKQYVRLEYKRPVIMSNKRKPISYMIQIAYTNVVLPKFITYMSHTVLKPLFQLT